MHGLEVCRGHVRLSLRRFQVRIAHHFLQQKDVSTPAQIARCERVPCGVERAPWCGEPSERQRLHVPQHGCAGGAPSPPMPQTGESRSSG